MSTHTIAQSQVSSVASFPDPSSRASNINDDDFSGVGDHGLRLPAGWEIRNLSDAIAGMGQEPPWIIKDLLLAQTATQVSAHPHSMKSLAWLAAALEAVAKQIVWGHFPAPHVASSLFIETEDSRWLLEERLRGLAKGLGLRGTEDVPGFRYLRTGPFDLVSMKTELTQILDYYKPNFAVLSTLQNLLGGRAWREQDEMQDVNALFISLADRFCPIVQITHSPWDPRQKRAIGSVSQAANFATGLHFEKVHSKDDTFVHVTVDSKLGVEEADFTLRLETDKGEVRRIVYDGRGRPKCTKKDLVLAAIENNPDATLKEVAVETGVSQRYVQQLTKQSKSKPRHK